MPRLRRRQGQLRCDGHGRPLGEIDGTRHRLQVQDEPLRLAGLRRQHEDTVRQHRSRDIQDQSGGAGLEAPEAKSLDCTAGQRRALRVRPTHLRQVDHHPKGVRQGKDPVAQILGKLEHEAGLIGMGADSGRGDLRRRPGRAAGRQPQQEQEQRPAGHDRAPQPAWRSPIMRRLIPRRVVIRQDTSVTIILNPMVHRLQHAPATADTPFLRVLSILIEF